MDNFLDKILGVLLVLLFYALIGLVMAYPVMLLWNSCVVGTIAGVAEITWLKAWGLNILCGFFFRVSVNSNSN